MPKYEYIRETPADAPDLVYWQRHLRDGWKLSAIEWKREVEGGPDRPDQPIDIPYGLRISSDCLRLEEDPIERDVLLAILESIVQDHRLSQVAETLNNRGYRTRGQGKWTPGIVFDLLPRLVEAGPGLLTSEDWVERRRQLMTIL